MNEINRKSVLAARRRRIVLIAGLTATFGWAGHAGATSFVGGVYAGTNRVGGNTLAAFGRNADGTLSAIREYATGGLGAVPEDSVADPLISADAVVNVGDRFVLTTNAGSNTVSSFRINSDYSLTLVNTVATGGTRPNSIAARNGLVYVANADADGVSTASPDESGTVTGFRLDQGSGVLTAIAGSTRALGTRPSNIEFSTDGGHLVVASHNAGSAMLAGGSDAELQSFGVLADGSLTPAALATAISTLPGNAESRNLPSVIDFEIVERNGAQIVIATESREYTPGGELGTLAQFQTGSVSTWRLNADGSLTPLSQDVLTGSAITFGPSLTDGPTSACWITVSPDGTTFWVTSASNSVISSFTLNPDGTTTLIESRAAFGVPADADAADPFADAMIFTDVAVSSDGDYLYQLVGNRGTIDVYGVGGDGASLALLQQTSGLLPELNTTGLISVSGVVPEPGTWALMIAGFGLVGGSLRRRRVAVA